MDGSLQFRRETPLSRPGQSFGEAPAPARKLDPGMGLAVA